MALPVIAKQSLTLVSRFFGSERMSAVPRKRNLLKIYYFIVYKLYSKYMHEDPSLIIFDFKLVNLSVRCRVYRAYTHPECSP
jgi:hypothetical protein